MQIIYYLSIFQIDFIEVLEKNQYNILIAFKQTLSPVIILMSSKMFARAFDDKLITGVLSIFNLVQIIFRTLINRRYESLINKPLMVYLCLIGQYSKVCDLKIYGIVLRYCRPLVYLVEAVDSSPLVQSILCWLDCDFDHNQSSSPKKDSNYIIYLLKHFKKTRLGKFEKKIRLLNNARLLLKKKRDENL
ncbi:hypothetical protein AGLY_014961 [Aphis glycines]|uniref:Uncharacterized protein n=1 Tax=Aphis glycines TaxID=307491 RepID=A0A6G0T4S1_APHGL|nr:hypothetical protein AGLY_014961 [Aphis glycines]